MYLYTFMMSHHFIRIIVKKKRRSFQPHNYKTAQVKTTNKEREWNIEKPGLLCFQVTGSSLPMPHIPALLSQSGQTHWGLTSRGHSLQVLPTFQEAKSRGFFKLVAKNIPSL